MMKRRTLRPERRSRSAKYIAHLLGLCFYFAIAASSCAIFVYFRILGFDLDFQISVSPAYLSAAAVFLLVMYALHNSYAEHINQSVNRLKNSSLIPTLKRGIGYATRFVVVVFMVGAAAQILSSRESSVRPDLVKVPQPKIVHAPNKAGQDNKPSHLRDAQRPAQESETVLADSTPTVVDEPRIATTDRASEAPTLQPPQAKAGSSDVCALNEPFSQEELEACTQDIKKHPRRTGVGGPGYSLRKDGDKWRLSTQDHSAPGSSSEKLAPPRDLPLSKR
jgi:hypothetical protein